MAPRISLHVKIALLILLFSTNVVSAQILDRIETSHSCNYFGESMPRDVTTFASDAEADNVIQDIVDHSGLVQNFEIRAAGVPNAAAIIQGTDRFIVYNQYFMTDTRNRTGSKWGPISIMAHEVGHHLNGHTLRGGGSRPNIELEADFYSGFILQKMGASLTEARIAMDKLGTPGGTQTHPAKRDRLAAITNGWKKACGAAPHCASGDATGTDPVRETEPEITGANSCEFARDGECDEPDYCDVGTDTEDCKSRSISRNRTGRDSLVAPRTNQLYCCDAFGNRRCVITFNPGPIGSPCGCYGIPGSGRMCP